MWFVFPQLSGLGHSQMARHFGLKSRGEAAAYLAHPLLRSCLTLFREIDGAGGVFGKTLEKYFDGEPDAATLQLLAGAR